MPKEFDSKGRNYNDNNGCKEEPRAQRKKYQLIPCRKNKTRRKKQIWKKKSIMLSISHYFIISNTEGKPTYIELDEFITEN